MPLQTEERALCENSANLAGYAHVLATSCGACYHEVTARQKSMGPLQSKQTPQHTVPICLWNGSYKRGGGEFMLPGEASIFRGLYKLYNHRQAAHTFYTEGVIL